jgi:spore maturation protein CgeB
VVHNAYHLQVECSAALVALGHRAVPIMLQPAGEPDAGAPSKPDGVHGDASRGAQAVDQLLRAIVAHRPDMLLTINYMGFDTGGTVGELLDAVGLPTAIWFVDNPMFAAQGYLPLPHEQTSLFSWDRTFVPVLAQLGAKDVHHLPLATDPNTFHAGHAVASKPYTVSFVGSSLVGLEARWRNRLQPPQRAAAAQLAQALLADRGVMVTQSVQACRPIDQKMLILAYANFVASSHYRRVQLEGLVGEGLTIFGDAGWRDQLPLAQLQPGFNYGVCLAAVYGASVVNINATNLQMPATVNQRVFDVPAAGGLLLSDRQAELPDYFEPGREVVVYDGPEHAADLARYFVQRPQAAVPIVAAAHRRRAHLRPPPAPIVGHHAPQARPRGAACRWTQSQSRLFFAAQQRLKCAARMVSAVP